MQSFNKRTCAKHESIKTSPEIGNQVFIFTPGRDVFSLMDVLLNDSVKKTDID